jgi:peptidoglycan/LPS O-acetylase OafA/YrhL
MGVLRLLLASAVLLSHLGVRSYGLNIGVVAVVIFYSLAGHVVASLWGRWQHQSQPIKRFYIDRSWRILPQYVVALLWASLLWLNNSASVFLSKAPNVLDWLANLLIVPLNYYMYTGQDHFTLIPPAWSLAAELQFYLLAPFILRLSLPKIALCLGLSLFVFVLAQLQWLDSDYYGYRLLPGVLFIFLLGALQQFNHQQSRPVLGRCLLSLWLINALYLLALRLTNFHQPYNQEVALGLFLAMPLLAVFAAKNQLLPDNDALQQLNKYLGALSYGVFLYHFPVLWLLNLSLPVANNSDIFKTLVLTFIAAVIGHSLIERPLWRLFRR